jgi:hypothetical protein
MGSNEMRSSRLWLRGIAAPKSKLVDALDRVTAETPCLYVGRAC